MSLRHLQDASGYGCHLKNVSQCPSGSSATCPMVDFAIRCQARWSEVKIPSSVFQFILRLMGSVIISYGKSDMPLFRRLAPCTLHCHRLRPTLHLANLRPYPTCRHNNIDKPKILVSVLGAAVRYPLPDYPSVRCLLSKVIIISFWRSNERSEKWPESFQHLCPHWYFFSRLDRGPCPMRLQSLTGDGLRV